jgi:hypothetical protein
LATQLAADGALSTCTSALVPRVRANLGTFTAQSAAAEKVRDWNIVAH